MGLWALQLKLQNVVATCAVQALSRVSFLVPGKKIACQANLMSSTPAKLAVLMDNFDCCDGQCILIMSLSSIL